MASAPTMLERLSDEDGAHFEAVKALLDKAGVAYELDATLVRGLDYYTRTVFEFESEALGAQAALGGGGRYDGLVEELGGPPTPAIGWAAGIERILLALGEPEPPRPVDVFIVAPDGQRERALELATVARRAGVCADLDLADRSHKGQMKQADRSGAPRAVILDEQGGATLRDMATGEERELDLSDPFAEIERERERDAG
jgi:histidyl-tRNA synthetase